MATICAAGLQLTVNSPVTGAEPISARSRRWLPASPGGQSPSPSWRLRDDAAPLLAERGEGGRDTTGREECGPRQPAPEQTAWSAGAARSREHITHRLTLAAIPAPPARFGGAGTRQNWTISTLTAAMRSAAVRAHSRQARIATN
jgi:hypothetical protein